MSVAPAPSAADGAVVPEARGATPTNSDTIEATDNLLAEAEDAALASLDTVGDLPEDTSPQARGKTAEPEHISDPCMQTLSRSERREAEAELRDMLAALRASAKAQQSPASSSGETAANLDSINVESPADASP